MIPRSYLFVPGDRPDRFAKGLASGAHVVMLDLEDGVAAADKATARAAIAAWLPQGQPVTVRVNQVRSAWFSLDVAVLGLPNVTGIVLPKVESAADIATLQAKLAERAIATTIPIVAMIETAQGVLNAREIAAAPGVARLAFGNWDLQLDIGIAGDNESLLFARSTLVLASRAADILAPLDGVSTVLDDMGPVAESVDYARRLGFRGKLCIHPRQVPIVNGGFGATPAEIDWARQIVAAVEGDPAGAIRFNGEMIDKPVIDRARLILTEA